MCECVRRRFRVLIKSEGGRVAAAGGDGVSIIARQGIDARTRKKGKLSSQNQHPTKPVSSQHMCFDLNAC